MLVIRRYQPTDHAAVWNLHNAALAAVDAHDGPGPWDADLDQIEVVYLDAGGEFYVGVCDGAMVAMGALKRTNGERAEIKRMRVHPSYQRRGFGQAILTAFEQRACELRYLRLHLDTTIQQIAAQRLYEKHGYREVSRTQVGRFTCIFYEKPMQP